MPQAVSRSSAIELQAPDITPWRHGNTGVDYVHVLDSGRPGATVMVQALTHGNELCGAIALEHLLRQRPVVRQGRLVLVFANVAAFERFDADQPHASRYVDEDYNRLWADEALFGARDSAELRRARALRPFVDTSDYLLDIHSMSEPSRALMVCGTQDKNARFACELGTPGDLLIDTGHPAGLRMVERGGFGDAASPKRALLIECGQHWEAAAADVAIDTLMRFLALTEVVDSNWALLQTRLGLPERQQLVRVTEAVVARSSSFEFLVPVQAFHIVTKAGMPIAQDAEHIWRAPYDQTVLVMPSRAHCRPGNTMARLGRFEPLPLAASPATT